MSVWLKSGHVSSELSKTKVCACTRVLACLQGFVLGCERVVVRRTFSDSKLSWGATGLDFRWEGFGLSWGVI